MKEFAESVTINEAREIISDYKDFCVSGVIIEGNHFDRAMESLGVDRMMYSVIGPVLIAEFAVRFI
jgi:hypothetical protein